MQILSLWIQLGITTAIILYASNFLAKSADNIADKTGLFKLTPKNIKSNYIIN